MTNPIPARTYFIYAAMVLVTATIFLLRHHEIHGENYYYWFFSKAFLETGRFPVFDRSPITALYLAPFAAFGFPVGVTAEFVFRSFVVGAGLFVFLRLLVGPTIAVFGALLWLPYLEDAAPMGQGLGLVCVLFAVWIRVCHPNVRLSTFYALLVLAYMFRLDFAALILLFAIFDAVNLFLRRGHLNNILESCRPRLSDWPVVLVVGLVVWFLVAQWDSPWNNAYGQPVPWLPVDNPKSLGQANFILLLNNWAIAQADILPPDYDIYFTHETLLSGYKNVWGIVVHNGPLVAALIDKSIIELIKGWVWMTSLPRAYLFPNLSILSHFTVLLVIFGAAFSKCADSRSLKSLLAIFVLGLIALKVPQIFGGGGSLRHFGGTVPVFLMAALGVAAAISRVLDRDEKIDAWLLVGLLLISGFYLMDRVLAFFDGAVSFPAVQMGLLLTVLIAMLVVRWGPDVLRRLSRRCGALISVVSILVFATPHLTWGPIFRDLAHDIYNGSFSINELREGERSPRRIAKTALPLIKNCEGILTTDALFFAAFTPLPIDKFHSSFEIPPFGSFATGELGKLDPATIDCLLIPSYLEKTKANAINLQRRYREYILPYARHLKSLGARSYKLPDYGEVIVLNGQAPSPD